MSGVVLGYAIVVLFGLLAGPTEALTQGLFGKSFFDSDWIHGNVSILFAIGYLCVNLSFLNALRHGCSDNTNNCGAEEQIMFRPGWFGGIAIVMVFASAVAQYLSGAQVHTPYLFGVFDALLPAKLLLNHHEPANALSVGW